MTLLHLAIMMMMTTTTIQNGNQRMDKICMNHVSIVRRLDPSVFHRRNQEQRLVFLVKFEKVNALGDWLRDRLYRRVKWHRKWDREMEIGMRR